MNSNNPNQTSTAGKANLPKYGEKVETPSMAPTTETAVDPKVAAELKAKADIKKAKKKEQREAKNKALEVIKGLVTLQKDPKYKAALMIIGPALYGVAKAGGGTSVSQRFIEHVAKLGSVKEDAIFKEFKFGRKDCVGAIRNHLKKAAPEDRIWVSFNADTETYTLEGKGVKIPTKWEGFIPTEEAPAK